MKQLNKEVKTFHDVNSRPNISFLDDDARLLKIDRIHAINYEVYL